MKGVWVFDNTKRASLFRSFTVNRRGVLLLAIGLVPVALGAWRTPPPGRGFPNLPLAQGGGGYRTVSPSVASSSAVHRDSNGLVVIDLLILWRGSPGWMYRRTESGSASNGGGPDRDGNVTFSEYQGGLHLTASFNSRSRELRVLGERVDLKGANVVLVDRVDGADGPVVGKTLTVPATGSQELGVAAALRQTPELLDYLRCEQQIHGGLNQPSMAAVCAEAVLKGTVKAATVMNEIPVGPVTNRAAGVAPSPRNEPLPPGAVSSGSGVMSAAVAGVWFTHAEAGGAMSLDLLVLWRGTPGWPLQGGQGSSGGGGSASSRRGMNLRFGGRQFYAAYDIGPRRYVLEDVVKPLGDDNVVLVDDVDSPTGPRVVKTLRVDPAVPDGRRIDQLIAGSPELVTYLRCDLKAPDPRLQIGIDMLCARYVKK